VSSSAQSPVNFVEYMVAQFTWITCLSIIVTRKMTHWVRPAIDILVTIAHLCSYQQIFSNGEFLLPLVRIGGLECFPYASVFIFFIDIPTYIGT